MLKKFSQDSSPQKCVPGIGRFPSKRIRTDLAFQDFLKKKRRAPLRPAGSDPQVVCQKDSFLKVSVSLGGFGPSVAHGKHSVRRRCVQATKKQGRNLLSP